MATFTSKAAGLASASGQTTWNEVGTPTTGDTVTLNHAVDLDYAVTLNTIYFGDATVNATFTISDVITVTGGIACQSSGGQYDAAQFNTLDWATGGKLILKPGSGQSVGIGFGTVGKFRWTGDVWLEFDDSDGGVSAYVTRGGGGFGQNFRTCMLDCDSCTLINMGTASEWGGIFTYFGSTNRSALDITCTNSSIKFEINGFFDFTGVLTINGLAISDPTGVGGLSEGLTINVDTAVVSNVVSKNANIYFTDVDTSEGVVRYFDGDSSNLTGLNVDTKHATIWNYAKDNPHADLPAGDFVYFEMPQAAISSDYGDLYPASGQTNTRLILPPIRTGASAGLPFANIHLGSGADFNFTLEQSILFVEDLLSGIYSGESEEGSAANKILSVKSNIFYGNGGYVLRDLDASPASDNYPAARFDYNLLDSRLDTGDALGIHTSINSSSGTFNANGQTVTGGPTFNNSSASFAGWGFTQNATTSDTNSIALLLADTSLVGSLFTYLLDAWQCNDAEADATGVGGIDMGVGYEAVVRRSGRLFRRHS